MKINYLKEIPELIELLKSEGLNDIAKEVSDSFHTACVGGELLTDCRYFLLQVKKGSVSDTTMKRIEAQIADIDSKYLRPDALKNLPM